MRKEARRKIEMEVSSLLSGKPKKRTPAICTEEDFMMSAMGISTNNAQRLLDDVSSTAFGNKLSCDGENAENHTIDILSRSVPTQDANSNTFSYSQRGETGAAIGGAVGGAIGSYYGGPIGEAVGKYVGEKVGDAAEEKIKEKMSDGKSDSGGGGGGGGSQSSAQQAA